MSQITPLNQQFNLVGKNQVWAGDVTYLKTDEGWIYLAIVMDLYSRRIVGWHIDKRMKADLVSKALIKARHRRGWYSTVIATRSTPAKRL